MDMNKISSYVIVDLETTGLPGLECGPTKITEMSMVAVDRTHFSSNLASPRVLNKLTMCFHPQKFISDGAARITGLTNELLEGQMSFNQNSYFVIEHFLSRLPRPICFIAHNGIRFDFPLLQAHMRSLGKKLPDDVLCADSLIAFRELNIVEGGETNEPPVETVTPIKVDSPSKKEKNEVPADVNECTDLEDMIDPTVIETVNFLEALYGSTPKQERAKALKKRTPQLRKNRQSPVITPVSTKKIDDKQIQVSVRKQLFPPDKRPSYKLESIYKHLIGIPIPNAHSAEGDAMALLECITAVGEPFHKWVLANYKKFNSIVRAW